MMPGRTKQVAIAGLADLAEVLPGISTGTRLEHSPAGSHQLVLSRHLVPGLPYRYHAGDEFRIDPGRNARRYELRVGDVLFMSRGTRNVASWIESVPDPTVAPVAFYILRPRSGMDAGYLTWFLNQAGAQRAIADIRTGAGTPIVQRGPFMQLSVPVPDLDTQRTIAAIAAAMARERLTLIQLAAATSRLHDLTSDRIARDLFARAESDDGE
jgi:hypothetical protein